MADGHALSDARPLPTLPVTALGARYPSPALSEGNRQSDGAMSDTFSIRRATVEDMSVIIGMIDEASAWLATKGTDQWARPWPSKIARDARVWRGINGRSTWIAEDQGEPVATITYKQNGNQNLWFAGERCDPAVYACRLVVSRKRAGDDIGAALIDWAGYRALQAWKAQWIRIDVWTENTALHRYYEKHGFEPVRICEFNAPGSTPSAALFQKPTAEVSEIAVTRFIDMTNRTSQQAVPAASPSASAEPATLAAA
jgi:GNAT superfamily N-acetyltransferase